MAATAASERWRWDVDVDASPSDGPSFRSWGMWRGRIAAILIGRRLSFGGRISTLTREIDTLNRGERYQPREGVFVVTAPLRPDMLTWKDAEEVRGDGYVLSRDPISRRRL